MKRMETEERDGGRPARLKRATKDATKGMAEGTAKGSGERAGLFHFAAFLILATAAFLAPAECLAYPELVRHGYVNCTTCHVSATGGGVITQYGRELSREILSTWSKEGDEASFAYGLVKPPEWLTLGGDLRTIALYKDTPTATEGQFFVMQADFEAAATLKSFVLDATFGYQDPGPLPGATFTDSFISRRHYLGYRVSDELSFRAGRFYQAYGINTPDHVLLIKRGLGWDERSETYNIEASWLGERWNFFVTANLGRPDSPALKRETGASATASLGIAEKHKVGVSYFHGANDLGNRDVLGPFAILGFTPRLFLLSEIDFQRASGAAAGGNRWGFVDYQRLDYEFTQGLHAYLTQELARLDFASSSSLANSYGLGLQFFPRPHFEINLQWQLMRRLSSGPGYSDFAWLMFHFYL